MGSVGGLLGLSGGAGGTGFAGPQAAQITDPVTGQQISTAYNGVQNSMQSQQNLLNALQNQNGLQNQSAVYNQLQGVVNGTGPNPAQAQLAQATGANTANQAALMAGQRGANQNVGLIARQAAMQGANNQQQSAGQAATMQAQQSLNALNSAGQMAGSMAANQIGQTNANTQAQQAEQQNLLNSQNAYNTGQVNMQGNINSANAGLANTQLQGQQATMGGIMNGASSLMSALAEGGRVTRKRYDDGGEVQPDQQAAAPQADFGNFQGANSNENYSMTPASFSSDAGAAALGGGGGKSGGGGGGGGLLALLAEGGEVQDPDIPSSSGYLGKSKFGAFLKGATQKPAQSSGMSTPSFGGNYGAQALYQALSGLGKQQPNQQPTNIPTGDPREVTNSSMDNQQTDSGQDLQPVMAAAEGGKVPAMVSPGEQYLPPKEVKEVAKGKKDPLKAGERIPGTPKVSGAKNSYANDTVPKTLEEGGIVIPRSITQGKNPHWDAMRFVYQTMKKSKKK